MFQVRGKNYETSDSSQLPGGAVHSADTVPYHRRHFSDQGSGVFVTAVHLDPTRQSQNVRVGNGPLTDIRIVALFTDFGQPRGRNQSHQEALGGGGVVNSS